MPTGMADPYAPDPDMPRMFVDPSQGNTLLAHLADIHTAWTNASLTDAERRTLFMRYALDWPQKYIVRYEVIAESTAAERLARAVGGIVTWLVGHGDRADWTGQVCLSSHMGSDNRADVSRFLFGQRLTTTFG